MATIEFFKQEDSEEIHELQQKLNQEKLFLEITQARLDLWNPCSHFSKDYLLSKKNLHLRIICDLEKKKNERINNRNIPIVNKRRKLNH